MSRLKRLGTFTDYHFLYDFYDDANVSYRDYLNDVDLYLLSNYYNIIVDIDLYNIFRPNFIHAHDEEFTKIAKAINADYNPIENYRMIETEEASLSRSNIEENESVSGTKTIDRSVKGSQEITTKNEDAVINSNSLKTSGRQTVTTTPQNYGESIRENYQNYSTNKNTNYKNPEKNNRSLTRSGNIGVTTSQQMIESTFELEKKNKLVYYISQVFINDLTTGIYSFEDSEVDWL